ncbi:MAG: electron transfer flavoprotein beta subunit/FixA family protein [Solirubrobacteraceae bacterium]
MKILVCISSVPDTTAKIEFTNGGTELDKNGVQFVINPYDEFCLTRAIWFQEKQGAKITILTIGDVSVEPVMRKALAIGADDAIRVNADPKDSLFVAKQIAKVAKEGEFDIILAGKESIDYNGGAVPGMVAALLGYGFVNACIGLEIDAANVTALREIDGGKESIKTQLPIVIAGQKGIVEESELKIPNMRGIMQARTKSLSVVEPEATEQKIKLVGFTKPASRSAVKLVDPNNIKELVRMLREEAKAI